MLKREEGSEKWPVYYTSQTFQGMESQYFIPYKAVLVLIIASWKLRLYFQVHKIIICIKLPFQDILQKPDNLGRLAKCCIELGKFDIHYEPYRVIKAQALADFVAEMTLVEVTKQSEEKHI